MPTKRSIILVIEDNPGTLKVLFELLTQAEYEVLVATDGDKALTAAEEGQPDLILLDVMLAGMDGFEICRRLKTSEITQAIPVIFMTALTKTLDKVKGFELGAVDYITKPFEPEEVLVRIKTHLTIQQLQHDLKENNDALQASLERERELSMLKSRLISIASHEFRTPLSTILFSKSLLKRYAKKIANQDIAQEIGIECDSIEQSVKQMTTILDEVLLITKAEAGKVPFAPNMIDVTELFRKVVEKFTALTRDSHTIVFAKPEEHIHLLADPKLMDSILSNLLSNAIKYSPQGGTVRCDLFQKNGAVLFSVHDEGIGIPETDQSHLFEAFHRGDNVSHIQGTGLGLSIVKQFVELHGGSIEVQSELNRGSTFTVVLPRRH